MWSNLKCDYGVSLAGASGANKTCPESQRLSNGSECLFGRCLSNGSALVTCVDTCVVMGRLTCSSCDREWTAYVGGAGRGGVGREVTLLVCLCSHCLTNA